MVSSSQKSVVGFTLLVALLAVSNAPAQASRELSSTVAARAVNDFDIVNFALNLEYLEANFYSCAVSGKPIPNSLTGGGPAPTGCTKALLSPEALAFATAIAADELAHVAYLRAALVSFGQTPAPQPQIELNSSFITAGNAAFNSVLSQSFTPYGSDVLFYLGAYIFEDVGATAYLGALPLIKNVNVSAAAGAIMGVESYHAGAIRTKLYSRIDEGVFPYNHTTGFIIQKISALRDAAGNTMIDAGLQLPPAIGGVLNLVPTNPQALLVPRTTAQVLSIVSLGGKSNKGGFFPNGLSGYIV